MSQLCEVNQIDRVGKIKAVGNNLMTSVASDAGYSKDGKWIDKTAWIEHRLFARQEGQIKWAREKLATRDIVFVRSTPSQTSYEKDGAKIYGFTFAVTELRLEVAKARVKDKPVQEAAPARGKAKGKKAA